METTASNFPGVFTVDTSAKYADKGLQGKDAVLIGLAGEKGEAAVAALRAQLISDNILREGQQGIQATHMSECAVTKEILVSRFEAKENQREIEEKIRLDGEKTRDLIHAQDAARLLDQIAALRAENARLLMVTTPPVTSLR